MLAEALLVLTMALLPYLPTAGFGYALDDLIQIVNNESVRGVRGALFYLSNPMAPGDLYRPLTMLSYGAVAEICGASAACQHIANMLMHGAVSLLVMLVLASVVDRFLAVWVAALFAVHPLHSEVVANVSGRAELLAALGVLGAIYCAQRCFRASHGPTAAALLIGVFCCSLAGMASKESALTVTALLPLTLWAGRSFPRGAAQRVLIVVAPIAAAVLYLAARSAALQGALLAPITVPFLDNPLAHADGAVRAAAGVLLLGRYLQLHFFPYPLSADYSFAELHPEFLLSPDEALLPLALLFILISAAIWLRRAREAVFFTAWFLCAFALTSNILFPIGTIFGERLAYLPGIGVLGLLVAMLSWAGAQRLPLLLAPLLLLSVVWSAIRSFDWRDSRTLIAAQHRISPLSAKSQLNYGMLLKDQKRFEDAAFQAELALKIYPQYGDAHWLLGALELERGNREGAERKFHDALRSESGHVASHVTLARLYMQHGHYDLARLHNDAALRGDPQNKAALDTARFLRGGSGTLVVPK